MAVVRGHLAGFPVVLSSATPSIESRVNADAGRYTRIVLSDRYAAATLPDIEAIDLRHEQPERGRFLSPPLVDRDRRNAGAEGAGAALPQPPRLRAADALPHLRPPLPVPELLDLAGRAPLPRRAALPPLRPLGEAAGGLPELRRHREPRRPSAPASSGWPRKSLPAFPEARTIVMSSDLAGGIDRLRLELSSIAKGEVDIVIGTQLVAKGHNFPLLNAGRRGRCRPRPCPWRSARRRTHLPAPQPGDRPRRTHRRRQPRAAADLRTRPSR